MKYAIVDVETTGDRPVNFKVIEIAIIIHDGVNALETFHSFVNPKEKINPFISRLTGITDEDVKNAPQFYEIAKKIIEFTSDTVFVAHNVSFDYSVLRSEYRRLGYDFRKDHLDTVATAKILFPGHLSYGLKNITQALGINLSKHHRALEDTKATAELFKLLYQKDKNKLKSFIRYEINPSLLNPNLKISDFDDIPNKIGIYKFFNDDDELIYIGKSIHIKKRIEQHLKNSKTQKGLDLRLAIAKIEYELTGSELIALLRESEEIKKNQPSFNSSQRNTHFTHGLYSYFDQLGYQHLHIRKNDTTESALFTFTSLKSAKNYLEEWLSEYELCQKLCHLHKGNSACFNHSIKKCNGACIEAESPENYNQKVNQLINDIHFNSQSFIIIDKGRNSKESSFVWINKGNYSGYGFALRYILKRNPQNFKKFLIPQHTNRDFQSIIRLQVEKNKKLEIIYLNQ